MNLGIFKDSDEDFPSLILKLFNFVLYFFFGQILDINSQNLLSFAVDRVQVLVVIVEFVHKLFVSYSAYLFGKRYFLIGTNILIKSFQEIIDVTRKLNAQGFTKFFDYFKIL